MYWLTSLTLVVLQVPSHAGGSACMRVSQYVSQNSNIKQWKSITVITNGIKIPYVPLMVHNRPEIVLWLGKLFYHCQILGFVLASSPVRFGGFCILSFFVFTLLVDAILGSLQNNKRNNNRHNILFVRDVLDNLKDFSINNPILLVLLFVISALVPENHELLKIIAKENK